MILPSHISRIQKLGTVVVLTVLLLSFARLTFQGDSAHEWEGRIRKALWSDSRLTHVFPRVDGRFITLHGDVADPLFLPLAREVASQAFPIAESVDSRPIEVAMEAPWLKVEIRDAIVVVAGQISNPAVQRELKETMASVSGSTAMAIQDFRWDPRIRRESWEERIVEFLPQLRSVGEYTLEIRNQRWVLRGEVEGQQARRDLAIAWEEMVPPNASLDLTGLRVPDRSNDPQWTPVFRTAASRGFRVPEFPEEFEEHPQ